MRRKLIAGNWKMNLDRAGAVALAAGVAGSVQGSRPAVAVFPPFVWLDAVREAIAGTPVTLGAQNASPEPDGAFTGEISMAMLLDCGCRHVILGHSERRQILGESDACINRKVHAALRAGLEPLVCVGETLEQREAGQTSAVVRSQMAGSLAGIGPDQMRRVVIAYEPVWAIGTGRNASPDQAGEVHADLRKWLAESYNPDVSDAVPILYGGSVKPANAAELLAQPEIDGALVGGASLQADAFLAIVEAAASQTG